jgi:hypothetical protein
MMTLERAVSPRQRHRVALAVLLGSVLSAIPIALVMRPSPRPAPPCLNAGRLRASYHFAVVSSGPDGKLGTADDIEVCR